LEPLVVVVVVLGLLDFILNNVTLEFPDYVENCQCCFLRMARKCRKCILNNVTHAENAWGKGTGFLNYYYQTKTKEKEEFALIM